MRFQRLLPLLVSCIALASASTAPAQNTDGIAAIVNDDVITFSDVKRMVEETEKMLAATLKGTELVDRIKEVRLDALKMLIERQLIIQEFKSKEYSVPDNIIEEQLQDIVRTRFDGNRGNFIKTLKAQGKTLEQFRDELKDNMIVGMMKQRFVSDNVIVSPFKIEQFYLDNAKEFTDPESLFLRLIYMKKDLFPEKKTLPDGSKITVDLQKKLAEDILGKLSAGADFSALATQFSEGVGKDKGGEWGWVGRDSLRKEIAEAAFNLFPGQHSGIIETPDGYYIVKVEDYRESSIKPIDTVREQIEKQLTNSERQKFQQEWIDRLKSKAHIKMF